MHKTVRYTLTILLFISTLSVAKDEVKLGWESTELADGLYMLSGVGGFTGGNLGLSVGVDGVILIDDAMPASLGIMNDAIKNISEKPIDFLINTHVHGDHSGNNDTLGNQGVHIVAHENLRKHLLTKGFQTPKGIVEAPKSALPVITFSESMDFHLNGTNAHVFHLAKAHTDGDSAIHFTDVNVIHMGDTFFNGMFPYIDAGSGGSLDGYIAAQKKVYAMVNDETKIIPGHGKLATKEDLLLSIKMLEDSKALVAALVVKGQTEDQILALNPLKKYHDKWNWGFITTEKMTKQMYLGVSQ